MSQRRRNLAKRRYFHCMPLRQVYKITYPNGKIYVGSDLTETFTYFGSPSASERIEADHPQHHHDLTVRKQILWESETADKTETLTMERRLIVETGANNPAVGYNLASRWTGSGERERSGW